MGREINRIILRSIIVLLNDVGNSCRSVLVADGICHQVGICFFELG